VSVTLSRRLPLLVATDVTLGAAFLLKLLPTTAAATPTFPTLGYSDVRGLWTGRGIGEGLLYRDRDFEYPVLTGAFAELSEALRAALSAAGLPLDGAAEHLADFIIAERDRTIVGCAAVERYGDAGLLRSVAVAESERGHGLGAALVERYRNPRPRIEAGQRLAPLVSGMMDVSDGLLIDSSRLAEASGTAAGIDLALVPLSEALLAALGDSRQTRLEAATAGDDYELLFAASHERTPEILALQDELGLPFSRIGGLTEGSGLRLTDAGESLEPPPRLGWIHR